MNRRCHSPVNSREIAAMYSGVRDGLSFRVKWKRRQSGSSPRAIRSRKRFFSQCAGLSGFVVPNSCAPGTDMRPSSWVKNSSGMTVISSTYARATVRPRRTFSDFASDAPMTYTVRPRTIAEGAPAV